MSCHVCYYAQTLYDILYVCQPYNEAFLCSDMDILDVCLRCLKHLMEGTEIYAMSAIKMQSDMICTCFNLDTQN